MRNEIPILVKVKYDPVNSSACQIFHMPTEEKGGHNSHIKSISQFIQHNEHISNNWSSENPK